MSSRLEVSTLGAESGSVRKRTVLAFVSFSLESSEFPLHSRSAPGPVVDGSLLTTDRSCLFELEQTGV